MRRRHIFVSGGSLVGIAAVTMGYNNSRQLTLLVPSFNLHRHPSAASSNMRSSPVSGPIMTSGSRRKGRLDRHNHNLPTQLHSYGLLAVNSHTRSVARARTQQERRGRPRQRTTTTRLWLSSSSHDDDASWLEEQDGEDDAINDDDNNVRSNNSEDDHGGEACEDRELSRLEKSAAQEEEEDAMASLLFDEEEDPSSSSMGAWVPVGSISCLQDLDPMPMEIMGRSFVVWQQRQQRGGRDGSSWSVLTDECPHRMAPLSQGRVDPTTNCLECPYHGWQFDANGTLTRIPHLEREQDVQSTSRSVQSFATHVTGDLLWVFLPTPYHGESFPRTLLPEHYYHGLSDFIGKGSTYYTQEMPFSFDFFVENVLDGPAHAYFAHHAFGFKRDEVQPLPVRIPISNFTELSTEVSYLRQGVVRRRRYGYQRPFMLMNQQPVKSGDWKTAIIFFAVPIREGRTRLITTFDTLSPHPATPDWILHIINQKFLEGDFVVHNAEYAIRHKLSPVPKYIYATSSDTSVKAWRSWWTKYGLSAAPPQTFGPASPNNLRLLDRHELSSVWSFHTQHCSKCRTALHRAKLARHIGMVLVWTSLVALLRRNRWVAYLIGLLGALMRWGATRLIQELEGPSCKSDVRDRSLSATL